jgi:hypothetical protein
MPLRYTTFVPTGTRAPSLGPSARGQAVGGLGWWIHNGLNALMRHQNHSAAEAALRALEPRILPQLHDCRGVLVRLHYWAWGSADATGRVVRQFKWATIAGTGLYPDQVYEQFQRQSRLEQAPPQGWVRQDVFVWVTEQDVRANGLREIH